MKTLETIISKVLFLVLIVSAGYTHAFGQNKEVNPIAINFTDNGNQIHGWFYKAIGNSPFSTVILLHGAIGRDGDLFKLGENLSKEGFNVIAYNYPGSWRSEGLRIDETALSSVQSAINFTKLESSIQSFEIDTSDIILIGYSYGGGMALLTSVYDHTIKKVISIAGGDLSVTANMIEESPDFRKSHQQMIDKVMSDSVMARGPSGKVYHKLLLKNRDTYNLKKYSGELVKKEVFLIAGWLDYTIKIEDHILPLYRELQSRRADNIKIIAFETVHQFANVQKELTEAIINWLKKEE